MIAGNGLNACGVGRGFGAGGVGAGFGPGAGPGAGAVAGVAQLAAARAASHAPEDDKKSLRLAVCFIPASLFVRGDYNAADDAAKRCGAVKPARVGQTR